MSTHAPALRVIRLLLALFVVAVCTAAPALAHNGVGAFFKGRSGGYLVYAYDGELLPGGKVDYKLVLLDRRTKEPIYDVSSTVVAEPPGDAAAQGAQVTTFGNVVYYRLPNPYPERWRVRLSLDGARGQAALEFDLHGVERPAPPATVRESGSSFPWWLVAVGGAVVLIGGSVVASRRRLRQSSGAPSGVDGPTTGKQDTA